MAQPSALRILWHHEWASLILGLCEAVEVSLRFSNSVANFMDCTRGSTTGNFHICKVFYRLSVGEVHPYLVVPLGPLKS